MQPHPSRRVKLDFGYFKLSDSSTCVRRAKFKARDLGKGGGGERKEDQFYGE